MSDDVKKRLKDSKTIVKYDLPSELKSDNGKLYPVDILKEAYTKSDTSIKSFCRRFGLNKALVEKYIAAGEWNKIREAFRERMFNIMASERGDILERRQSIVQRAEVFKLLELEQTMHDLEDHFLTHGDFFARDSENEIIRDSYGNPTSRRVGLSKNDLAFLREMEAIREINRKLLQEAEQDRVNKVEGEKDKDIIDVDSYFEDK